MSTAIINVSNLDGSNGFRLDGEANSFSGSSVNSLGDINGDGFGDVAVGAYDANGLGASSYVVFGQAAGFNASRDLSSLDGHDGFRVHGMTTYDRSSISINAAGDINGDGAEDMIVEDSGFSSVYEHAIHSYVVFGKTSGFSADIDLTHLNGNDGFRMQGGEPGSNEKMERAGDINGDGLADVIVSSTTLDSNGNASGSSYVVFGRTSGFDPALDLSSLDGQDGFVLKAEAGGQSVYAVHDAGDVNGDGLADVIVGDSGADPHGNNSGSTYVVFGKTSEFDAVLDLSSLDGQTGFRLDGEEADSSSGITSVGDINGDGFDDVIINAPGANKQPYSYYSSGARYVVFGKASGFDAHMDLSSLDGNNGFRLNGPANTLSISSAGDINGDGFDDVFIGSRVFSRYSSFDTGYVLFGKASGFDAAMDIGDLNGQNGFQLSFGGLYASTSFSRAGDVNGDGFDDLIVGVQEGYNQGSSYLVLGKASGFSPILSYSDSSIGVRFDGEAKGDFFGDPISSAGDVNSDGFDDLIIGATGTDPNGENSGSSYIIFGRSEFHSDETIRGTPGDDVLTGTVGKDHFEAGDGNDSMAGLGGADTFLAGNGDDILKVADLDFQLADGGAGMDTLELTGGGLTMNLADLQDRIDQIETIDLTGDGDNTLSFSLNNFLDLSTSASSRTITVEGNTGDHVQVLDGNWVDGGTDQNYRVFMHNGATLRVDRSVDTDIVAGQGIFDLGTLDGSNGFRLDSTFISAIPGVPVGSSVSSAGDINGDGFDDVIIGAPNTYLDHRDSVSDFVVLGKASGFDAQMDLSKLDGSNGFRLDLAAGSGETVSNAGDVNGDGFDDVIIGASYPAPNGLSDFGSSYVVLGKASGFDSQMDLSKLDGSNGFRMVDAVYSAGMPVSSAGDINGDGFDDVILGSSSAGSHSSGSSYVVFGRASGFDASMNLASLNGNDGFRLDGAAQNDDSGVSVSGAGDVNGDGFDDVIVGAAGADPHGEGSGSSYVVFGRASGFDASMDLASLNGNNGFRLDGVAEGDLLGGVVSNAGDVNGDGFDDVIVSATGADPNGDNSGSSYVVFGRASGFDASMNLSSLDGSNGFRLDGAAKYDHSGQSVSGAGDVNGDGYDDVIIGVPQSGPYLRSGSSYVVFGKASGFDATLNLDDLDGNNGFRVDGASVGDYLGSSVSAAGDVNGDGFDDLLVGATGVDSFGSSYIIFGSREIGHDDGGGELPEITGTADDDTLKGSEAAEHFIAGEGNDNLLGRGGADIFDAGAGDDAIRIGDLTFAAIDGGEGNDALHLAGSGMNLDLTTLGDRIHNIETICLYGRGDNTLTLTAESLLSLSDSTNALKVHGNSGDHIALQDSGWVDGGSQGFYHTYTCDDAVLLVGANVTVEMA